MLAGRGSLASQAANTTRAMVDHFPICPACGFALSAGMRFCPACGRYVEAEADTVLLPRRVRVEAGRLDTRELLALVEAGVAWWRTRLESASSASRQEAAEAIGELSRILRSLAAQLAQGRDTVRITTRLPVQRAFPLGCPVCGRGNREGARYCLSCGALLTSTPPKGKRMANTAWKFQIGAKTDVGKVRARNEDSCYVGPITTPEGFEALLCLVADGMGGARAGAEASRLAVETVRQQIDQALADGWPSSDQGWQALLRQATLSANARVYSQARASSTQRGMGTTLTAVVLSGDRAQLAQVGDSRAYLFNRSGLTADGATLAQLTHDHSLVARLVDIGQITPEEARSHPQKHMLYRSLGTDPSVDVDTYSQALQAGDVLLLCSDGLTNHVEDEELARIVLELPDPDEAATRLVALANERGGRDNISAIVVQVDHS
jgi:protein phosphatase